MNYFDPVSLRLFIAICERQSLTDAADQENLTVSAISKRLTALEEQIGVPLLQRGRGGVQLTVAGEALLPAARGLLQSMARIQASLSEYARMPGHVRVVATPTALTSFLPNDLAAFIAKQPDLNLHLEEQMADDIVRAVEEGRADLGISWDRTDTRRLKTVPYRNDHLVVIAHREHELARREVVSFADTLPYKRVTVDTASTMRHLQERLAIAQGSALKSDIGVKNYDSACRIAQGSL